MRGGEEKQVVCLWIINRHSDTESVKKLVHGWASYCITYGLAWLRVDAAAHRNKRRCVELSVELSVELLS